MSYEVTEDISYDYDENSAIDDDEVDSVLSGESGKRERRRRSIPDLSSFQLLTKRRKFTNFFFRRITIISFIPTFIYNSFWINKLKKTNIEGETAIFDEIKNYIIIASYSLLIKSFCLLFLPKIICGSEKKANDFRWICAISGYFTTFLISIYSIINIKKLLNLDNNSNLLNISNKLYYWINLYYKSEYAYIIVIVALLSLVFLIILIKILKEIWSYIRYTLE